MNRKVFLDSIRKLELQVGEQAAEIWALEQLLNEQGAEVQGGARASMQVIQEDAELLANYKTQNTMLIAFVEKIADSKSKFRKEACSILGF